jgi:hypothetical protein
MAEIGKVAYILALVGGILLIIFGLLSLIGYAFDFIPRLWSLGFSYAGIISIIGGVIAVIGAKSASTIVWAIVLIVIGIICGGLGGLLVLFGGIIGLISVLVSKA